MYYLKLFLCLVLLVLIGLLSACRQQPDQHNPLLRDVNSVRYVTLGN